MCQLEDLVIGFIMGVFTTLAFQLVLGYFM